MMVFMPFQIMQFFSLYFCVSSLKHVKFTGYYDKTFGTNLKRA